MGKPHPPLSADRQIELVKLSRQGDRQARDELVNGSLGLVVSIAADYAKVTPGVEMDDLVQEGSLGLLDAIRYFNYQKGFQFSTYAGDCIRRRIFKYVEDPKTRWGQDPDDDLDLNEVLEDEPDEGVEEQFAALRANLARLHQTDRYVIEARCGYGPDGVQSWQAIASKLGLKQKIVKAIYERGVKTLRRQQEEAVKEEPVTLAPRVKDSHGAELIKHRKGRHETVSA